MWTYTLALGKVKRQSILAAFYATIVSALILVLAVSQFAGAAPDAFPSTNDMNMANGNHHVSLIESRSGEVELKFSNPTAYTAYYELRFDGIETIGNATHYNPCKTSASPLDSSCNSLRYIDDDEPYYANSRSVAPGGTLTESFSVNSTIEVRSAVGPERDWDFNWVSFSTFNPDPSDSHQLTLSGHLYRDIALYNCDNRTECLFQRTDEALEGWTVKLYIEEGSNWTEIGSDITDVDGYYIFPQQQEAGIYHVCEVLKPGWTQPNQTWNGSGYLVNTPNLSGNSEEGSFCTTTTYDDSGDRSSKSKIGNVDDDAPEDAYFTSPLTGSDQRGNVTISAFIEDYATGLGQQQIVMRRPDNSIAGNWSYNVKNGTSRVISGAGVISYSGNSHAGIVTVTIDSATLEDGRYNLRLFTNDAVGIGRSNVYSHYYIDNTAPEKVAGTNIVINSTAHSCGVVTSQRSIVVDWNDATDINFAYYQYQADADRVSPIDYTTTTIFSERPGTIRDQDGTYNYRIRAVDSAGNSGEWSDWCSVTLDRFAPIASIRSHSNGEKVSGTITLIGEVVDENPMNTHFRIEGPSGLVQTGTFRDGRLTHNLVWDTSATPDGTYTIYFETRDKAGNKLGSRAAPNDSVAVISLVTDNTTSPPTATRISSDNDQSPEFEGTAEENALVTVEINGIFESSSADEFGNWTMSFTDEFDPGSHTAFVTATDEFGNSETISIDFTIEETEAAGGVIEEEEIAPLVVQQQPIQPNLLAIAPQPQNAAAGGNVLAATNDTTNTEENNTNENNGTVLQASTDNPDTDESDQANEGCFKIFGVCWYWVAGTALSLLGLLGYVVLKSDS